MTERPQNKPQDKKLNQEIKMSRKKIENKVVSDNNKNSIRQQEEVKKMEQKEMSKIEDKKEKANTEKTPEVQHAQQLPQKKEEKAEEKKEEKPAQKKAPQKISKKEEAIARGVNLHTSKKHCMYICKFIKNKEIDKSIEELNEVIKMKKPIPFKGEIPHRSYPGMMSGRYPVKAAKEFIYLLKGLKGNVLVNGMDLDKTRIYFASATWDSRPAKKGGMRFKRAFVVLKAKEFPAEQEIKHMKTEKEQIMQKPEAKK